MDISHLSMTMTRVVSTPPSCSMPRAGILRRGPPPLAVLSVQGQFGLFRVCCFKFLRLRIQLQLQPFGLRSHQLSRHPPERIPGPPYGQVGGGQVLAARGAVASKSPEPDIDPCWRSRCPFLKHFEPCMLRPGTSTQKQRKIYSSRRSWSLIRGP